MRRGVVVLAGKFWIEPPILDRLVAEFGWSFERAECVERLMELNSTHNVVSVLFSPSDLKLPWDRALRSILDATPVALPILCHGFSEAIDWPQAAAAGAFHSLWLPFDFYEVRQSLGFVRSAKASEEKKVLQRSR